MTDLTDAGLRARADEITRRYFSQCPPPDAGWFVDVALKPILHAIVFPVLLALRDAARAALDEEQGRLKADLRAVAEALRHYGHRDGRSCNPSGCPVCLALARPGVQAVLKDETR